MDVAKLWRMGWGWAGGGKEGQDSEGSGWLNPLLAVGNDQCASAGPPPRTPAGQKQGLPAPSGPGRLRPPPHASTSRPPPWPPQVPPPRRPPRVGSVLVRNPPGAWLGRKRSALRRFEPRRGVLVSARPDLHQHRHARGLPGGPTRRAPAPTPARAGPAWRPSPFPAAARPAASAAAHDARAANSPRMAGLPRPGPGSCGAAAIDAATTAEAGPDAVWPEAARACASCEARSRAGCQE